MTISISLPTPSDQPLLSRQTLPTMYDLPSEHPEDSGLPDLFHLWQSLALDLAFHPKNIDPEFVFAAIDLNVYYDVNHPQWYKRPDWFGVVGVPKFYDGHDLRLSYVIWIEQVSPIVVVELLSPGTEDEDLGRTVSQPGKPPTKWEVYEQILRVPYYFVFSRYNNELQAFHLVGDSYEPMESTDGRWLIPEIGLSLGLWQGSFKGLNRLWLRWMTLEGDLIPLPTEEAVDAKQEVTNLQQEAAEAKQEVANVKQEAANAKQEAAEAKQEVANVKQEVAEAKNRIEQLEAQLRALGINTNDSD